MAHTKPRTTPGDPRFVYLVDAAVGRSGANRRDDVFLVQFFLNSLWKGLADGTVVGAGAAPAIDGVCGPVTIRAIELFQRAYWGPGSQTDGLVEPVPPRSGGITPRTKSPYTMVGLNANFGLKFGWARHALLCNEPTFPAELTQKLFLA